MADGAMFASIVVGTDGSPTAAAAVERARALAAVHTAAHHNVTAFPSSHGPAVAAGRDPASLPPLTDPADVEARDGAERLLAGLRARFAGDGLEVTTHALGYSAVNAILDVAAGVGADVIVVGNKGMQGTRRDLRGVPSVIAHSAPCDVLIVNTT